MSPMLQSSTIFTQFHQVGLPDEPLQGIKPQMCMSNGSSIGASHIGSGPKMLVMLELEDERGPKHMVETIPISEKGCAEAVERVKNNKVHHRFTLTGYNKAFLEKIAKTP